MENNPFKSIVGGKSTEPNLTTEKRRSTLKNDIISQENSTEEKGMNLEDRIKKEMVLEIKASVLKFNGRILTDEETDFINRQAMSLSENDQLAQDELQKRFPDLVGFFDQIFKNLEKITQDLAGVSLEEMAYIDSLEVLIKKEKAVDQFKDLDFGSLDEKWKEIGKGSPQEGFSPEKNYSFYQKIGWGEQELFLSALKMEQLSEDGILLENINFQLGTKKSIVRAEGDRLVIDDRGNSNIEFSLVINHLDKPCPTIETLIIKNDPNKELPSRMTLSIYRKLFEYMQGRASKDKHNYLHRISRMTSISEQEPLSNEKWNEIFLFLIEKNKYKQFSPTTWTKEYKPE